MYDQTKTHSSSGMGGMSTMSSGMDSGQSDQGNASSRLRVRVAGTALFTVGLAAMGYSMVDKGMGKSLEVNDNVKDELPDKDFLKLDFEKHDAKPPEPLPQPKPDPIQPNPNPTPPHSHEHNGLHDFTGCGSFAQAFAHARAEFGKPGEVFIYHGKPYTTTYKHEVEHTNGHVHVEHGLEVVMVISEDENGNKVLAADTDKDGKADSWFFENNDSRYQLVDSNGDGKLDSYIDKDNTVVFLDEPIEQKDDTIPGDVFDVITVDGVQFLAYGSEGEYTELIGEHDGQIIYYQDTDGDGSFDHAAFLNDDFKPIKEWGIDPVTIEEIDVETFEAPQTKEPIEEPQGSGQISDNPDDGFIGPEDEKPIIDENDLTALEEDPYRVDAENEILSGGLNNHADMSDFVN